MTPEAAVKGNSDTLRFIVSILRRKESARIPLLEIEKELAKQRMICGKEDPTLNLEEGEAVEKVAPSAGISPALYYQCISCVLIGHVVEIDNMSEKKYLIL